MLQGGHNSQFEIGLVPKTGLEFERIEGSWLAVLEVTQGRAKFPQGQVILSEKRPQEMLTGVNMSRG